MSRLGRSWEPCKVSAHTHGAEYHKFLLWLSTRSVASSNAQNRAIVTMVDRGPCHSSYIDRNFAISSQRAYMATKATSGRCGFAALSQIIE
nr:hypothetical protein CFP56_53584 [Quercus suber]